MTKPILLTLLEQEHWGVHQALVEQFRQWEGYALFEERMNTLNRAALFDSKIHGVGHIERTMCHGAMCAMAEPLNEQAQSMLLYACAYHDTGRKDDTMDDLHGHRSAQKLPTLIPLAGETLRMTQAAIDAHSRSDSVLVETVKRYQLEDVQQGIQIAQLLKDADGLDRVRIWDLDPRYLRRESSRQRADFARELYIRYQQVTGGAFVPDFVQRWKGIDAFGQERT